MKLMPKLKPCPFCGSDEYAHYDDFCRAMVCNNCGAKGPEYRKTMEAAAIAAWNTRDGKEPQQE